MPKRKILVVTGSAPCVLEDCEALRAMIPGKRCEKLMDWMAIGLDAVDKYPWPIRFMATYHPDDLEPARRRREKMGGNTDYIEIQYDRKYTHTATVEVGGERYSWDHESPTGSSALMGAIMGLKMGYGRIVLCGIPLSGAYERFQRGWRHQEKLLRDRVKSMSGWTREFLGEPTHEWLNGRFSGTGAE